jgi:hypothetical protein
MVARAVAGGLLAAVLFAAAARTAPGQSEYSACRGRLSSDCNAAFAAWLPSRVLERESLGPGTEVSRRDDFVYGGQSLTGAILSSGPQDGVPFVYQPKGFARAKGQLAYDYAHHIAFYDEGCCAWSMAVAAYAPPPPLEFVVSRNLATLHTSRGIALGMSAAALMRVYGKSRLYPTAHHAHLRGLWYSMKWSLPGESVAACEQDQTFVFRADELILIQLNSEC